MIAHIVLFEPKPGISSEQRRSFAIKFGRAVRDIGTVGRGYLGKAADIDAGYERSFGDKTYSYAAVLEFSDREGLLAYLRHPLHVEIGRLFWQACERTAIVEVDTRDIEDPELGDFLV